MKRNLIYIRDILDLGIFVTIQQVFILKNMKRCELDTLIWYKATTLRPCPIFTVSKGDLFRPEISQRC